MKRFLRIFSLYFQHVFQHRARNFLWFLIAFINPLVLLLFWQGVLSADQTLHGWNINSIRTYYLLLIIAQAGLMNHVELYVAYIDIKQGELIRELLRPFPYLLIRSISESPWRILQMSYALITVTLLAVFLKIPIELSNVPIIITLSLLVALNAFAISFMFKMILGLTAFWMTNIDSILETNDVLIFALSGLIIPINLFPTWMFYIAKATPFPYILYYPITAFIGLYNTSELLHIILIQFGWILGFTVIYKVMWKQGLRKFSGIGQ